MALSRLTEGWFGLDTTSTSSPIPIAGQLEGECILVPLLTSKVPALTDQLKVATTLARANDSALYIANPISVPEQTPQVLRRQVPDREDTELLDWAVTEAMRSTPHVDGGMLYTRRVVNGVLQTVATNDIDTVVLPRVSAGSALTGETTERIARRAECDTIVVNGQPGFEWGPSILLPIAGGPHSGVAADVASCIAAVTDAWIDILHVIETKAPERQCEHAEEYVEAAYHRIARPETTTTWILEADDLVDAIIEQSRYYSLTVIGAPTKSRLQRFIYGSTNRAIRSDAQTVVLSARNNTEVDAVSRD